jgi:hypothetical protein
VEILKALHRGGSAVARQQRHRLPELCNVSLCSLDSTLSFHTCKLRLHNHVMQAKAATLMRTLQRFILFCAKWYRPGKNNRPMVTNTNSTHRIHITPPTTATQLWSQHFMPFWINWYRHGKNNPLMVMTTKSTDIKNSSASLNKEPSTSTHGGEATAPPRKPPQRVDSKLNCRASQEKKTPWSDEVTTRNQSRSIYGLFLKGNRKHPLSRRRKRQTICPTHKVRSVLRTSDRTKPMRP